jgi:hypothetical protein
VRGKNQRRQRNRRDRALAAEIERLHEQLDVETRRADTARHGAARARAARVRLLREQRANNVRLHVAQRLAGELVANTTRASEAVPDARRELRAVTREMSASLASVRLIRQAGGKTRFIAVHRSATPGYLRDWYRVQTHGELDTTREISLIGWTPDDVPAHRDALAPYATSTVYDTSPEACWTWAIPPWLALPDDGADAPQLRTELGATTTGRPGLIAHPYPRGLRPGAVITSPWRHAPVIGHPADAIDLAHWYHRAAFAQGWHPDQQPAPFWLPAEHATSYPQARSLPPETDLRLPHPLMFVAFAAPWHLEPRPGHGSTEWQTEQMYARGSAAQTARGSLVDVLGRLQATGLTRRDELPTPLELLETRGGNVEGLLLTANPDGTPTDEFAWCLVVNHPCGFPLARLTIPASRERTQWRAQVDNIVAGVCLSQWHEPTAPLTAADSDRGVGPAATALDDVRVLDIDATSPRRLPRPALNPTRPSRPHLRRGHWRQQRVGHHREHCRWTWVRATTVNAAWSPANQVYTLRTADPARI